MSDRNPKPEPSMTGPILAADIGLCDLGWAVVTPRTGRVVALGQLHQEPIVGVDKATCRGIRSRRSAELLIAAAREYHVTAIAAEAMLTFAGRFTMAISVGLSFEAITAIAAALGLPLLAVPPKRWQRPVVGREPGDRRAVDYAEVERRLSEYVVGGGGRAAEQLEALKPGRRNHALDAVGVGVFAAMRGNEATRIGRS
jgi:hypothetical protein